MVTSVNGPGAQSAHYAVLAKAKAKGIFKKWNVFVSPVQTAGETACAEILEVDNDGSSWQKGGKSLVAPCVRVENAAWRQNQQPSRSQAPLSPVQLDNLLCIRLLMPSGKRSMLPRKEKPQLTAISSRWSWPVADDYNTINKYIGSSHGSVARNQRSFIMKKWI